MSSREEIIERVAAEIHFADMGCDDPLTVAKVALETIDLWPLVEASEELIKHAHYDPKSERDTFKVEEVWVKGLDTALAKSRGVEP